MLLDVSLCILSITFPFHPEILLATFLHSTCRHSWYGFHLSTAFCGSSLRCTTDGGAFFFSDPCRPRRLPSERRCGQGVEREPMFGDGQQVLHVLEPPSWPIFLRCDETTNHIEFHRVLFFMQTISMSDEYWISTHARFQRKWSELHSLKYQLQVDCRHPNMLATRQYLPLFATSGSLPLLLSRF